jgi:hypothetical protein
MASQALDFLSDLVGLTVKTEWKKFPVKKKRLHFYHNSSSCFEEKP